MKYIADNEIKKVHIINDWFDKLAKNTDNQVSIILFIENQIESCEKIEFKLKVIMKKSVFKYANEVIDVNVAMNILVIMNEIRNYYQVKML